MIELLLDAYGVALCFLSSYQVIPEHNPDGCFEIDLERFSDVAALVSREEGNEIFGYRLFDMVDLLRRQRRQ